MTKKYEYTIEILFPKGTKEADAGIFRDGLKKLFPKIEVSLIEHEYNEPEILNGKTDMMNQPCKKCGVGKYQETQHFDDIDGVLHCNKCGNEINRWYI